MSALVASVVAVGSASPPVAVAVPSSFTSTSSMAEMMEEINSAAPVEVTSLEGASSLSVESG
jgi:hypothetical protein